VRREHDDGHGLQPGGPTQGFEHGEPVRAGQTEVEKDAVGRGTPAQLLERVIAGPGFGRLVAEVLHGFRKAFAERVVVIDDQDGRHGKSITKRVTFESSAR
jgi:hypothetical protein